MLRLLRASAVVLSTTAAFAVGRAQATTASTTAFPVLQPEFHGVREPLRLVQIQVIMRHGDRTPISDVGADVPAQARKWAGRMLLAVTPRNWTEMNVVLREYGCVLKSATPQGTRKEDSLSFLERIDNGQLTTLGADKLVDFGRSLGHYLSTTGLLASDSGDRPDSVRDHLTLSSTMFRRTVLSVACVARGLLEVLEGPAAAEPALPLVPIAVPPSVADELLFVNSRGCARLVELFREQASSADVATMIVAGHEAQRAELDAVLKQLNAGLPDGQTEARTSDLFDAAMCRLSHGDGMSELGLNATLWHSLQTLVWRKWALRYRNPELGRLAIGRLVNRICTTMNSFAVNSGAVAVGPRVVISCGHDSTLVPLLCVMNVEGAEAWPAYGSSLTFELYRGTTSLEYYVRVLYDGVPVRVLHASSELLSLEEFRARTRGLIPHNFAVECRTLASRL